MIPDSVFIGVAIVLAGAIGWYFGYLYGVYDAPAKCTRLICRIRKDSTEWEDNQ